MFFAVRAVPYNNNPDNYDHLLRQTARHQTKEHSRPAPRPLSGRFFPGSLWKAEKHYPDAAKAPTTRNKRVSNWFMSSETGPKLFGKFGARRPLMKPQN